jgi:23S rRNA (cytidine1920-2'-O)/16S rRNA (cytidine1409-2'-O)-methyltransferase
VPRLDHLLVDRGIFSTREQARRAVMAGAVLVDGERRDKPGATVPPAAMLSLKEREPYVSRGGRKLAGALDHFAASGLDPQGRICIDAGASTGGFTDCLLQRGAARIYAADVGYGQLDSRLRADPRVVVLDRVNVRHLTLDALPERVSLVVADLSFISLLKVAPALLAHLEPGGFFLPLIKPQFEAGRGAVGKGGIVRDEATRRRAIDETVAGLARLDLDLIGVVDSALPGAEGNREAFALMRRRR